MTKASSIEEKRCLNKVIICLVFLIQIISDQLLAQEIDSIPKTIQREIVLHSTYLKEDRTIWIHLPPGYNQSTDSYPVLYLLDGGSHFRYASEIVDYLSGFESNYIPGMIVVGIPNVDRGRDFTPKFPTSQETKNGAADFLSFIKNELLPYIDKTYRTQPYRVLEAHSLGGLFGIYAMASAPELFQASIIISPALTGDRDKAKVMSDFKSSIQKNVNHKMFITLGNEGPEAVTLLTKLLKDAGHKSSRWQFRKYENENHFSVPFNSVYDGLRFIYANWHMEIFLNSKALPYADVENHFHKLSDEFGYPILPTEDFLNQAGYEQLRFSHVTEAIELFRQNIRLHPDSYNVYDSMGEAYMTNGQNDLALEYYKKSVAINPDNENGKQMIEKLKLKMSNK